ncbi:MAG: hypothetical protein COA79_16085 [Planctomycetota bacterium]|nr:MAG: hypothetical protein COA79_16085 [Planctomycetota bacterium]
MIIAKQVRCVNGSSIEITLLILFMICLSIVLPAETKITWISKDIIESKMLRYKYSGGERHSNPKDGTNYASRKLRRKKGPAKVYDRVLKRNGRLSGSIKGPPSAAVTGRAWLEDNYGRVLDSVKIKAPKFTFALGAGRAMHTGIYLKASLSDGAKKIWNGSVGIRMTLPEKDQWREFILGVYNMGTKSGTGQLWRELGLSHRAIQTNASPKFPLQNDLKYHSSNILYSVLGLYHRDFKHWREMKAKRKEPAAKGPVTLARHICLSNPEYHEFMDIILTASAQRFKPYPPLHYSIGDEIGIGNMASPHDLCASKWCLPRFQKWLQKRYQNINALNKQWGSDYKTWNKVEMMSNFQALARKPSGNYSPWADRLEFMDFVIFDYIKKGTEIIRKVDPDAVCNISGWQPPSCWGFDNWLLSKTVDCVTPYEIGESPDIMASFYDDGKSGKIYSPGFGGDMEKLWLSFLRGYSVSAQWDSFGSKVYSKLIDIGKKELTTYGKKLKVFADWVNTGPGRLRNRSERLRDPVAILHSQPSIRANWMLELTDRSDVHNSGDRWVHRDSWSVGQREMMFRLRISWVMWTHDIGIWPKFVDTRDLGNNYLIKKGYKVLIVPRVAAMSDETAARIKAFAEAGGTVIADTWCGIMDERCKLRTKGALDDFFGITRSDMRKLDLSRLKLGQTGIEIAGVKLPFLPLEKTLKAVDAKAGAKHNGADIFISKKVGKGKAVYLNFKLESYFLHRLKGERVSTAKSFLLNLLADSGVKPIFSVTQPGKKNNFHTVGHDICLYKNGNGYLVGVRPNPTVIHSDVGGVENRFEKKGGNVYSKKHAALLNAPKGFWAYDVTVNKNLGKKSAVSFTSDPDSGRLYAFWPFSIDGVSAKAVVTDGRLTIKGKLKISGGKINTEKLVVNIKVFKPDGSEQQAYRRNIDLIGDEFSYTVPLGLNEKGSYKVKLIEPCSGKTLELTVVFP